MAHTIKIFLFSIILMISSMVTFSQQPIISDTIPIRYIAWNHYLDTYYPVLIQKKGFLVINKSNLPELLTTQRFLIFEDVLDGNKKREKLCIVKLIPYYMD